jgi:hypothetical protein
MSKIRLVLALMGAIGLMVSVQATPALAAGGSSGVVIVQEYDYLSFLNCNGTFEDFRVNANGTVDHNRQLLNGSWSGWEYLRGQVRHGRIAGFRNSDCRLEIFGVGTDGKMYTTWQYDPSGYVWPQNWASLDGGFLGGPTAYQGINPRGERVYGVCATGLDGYRWCNFHSRPGGTAWLGWSRM